MANYTGSTIFDILTSQYVPTTASGQTDTFRTTAGGSNTDIANVKIKAIYGNYNYNASVQATLFDDITANDTFMCVRIFHGDLTVSDTFTTPSHHLRGLFVVVKGNLTINSGAKIDMTARGANATGENVYFATNNLTAQLIPATGASGATARTATSTTTLASTVGTQPTAATARRTGGGGSGAAVASTGSGSSTATSGAGAAGTSYSGGAGGGGCALANAVSASAGSGAANGGAGGDGRAQNVSTGNRSAGGGAGNNGGNGKRLVSATGIGGNWAANNGSDGTGGLLILIALNNCSGTGTIESRGSKGGEASDQVGATGGGSGGGSINVLSRKACNYTLNATGVPSSSGTNIIQGGTGGNGFAEIETYTTATRQSLFKRGSTYHYYNFSSSSWIQVTDSGTEAELVQLRGMFDGELSQIDRAKLVSLYGASNMSTVTLKTHNG
jgi:hypothetical protein